MTNRTTFTRASATGNLQSLVTNYNANLDALEVELENSLSRKDNILPNSMEDELDMNGNDIINVNEIGVAALTINGTPVQPFAGVTVASAFQSYTFTATSGQTSFSVAPYTAYVASVQVEVNGLALPPADISVSGTNVIIPACAAGDEVVIRRYTSAPSPFPSADDITFNQVGTVNTRSVQNKLRDVVSVKDFGAVGDGVANDTAAVQAAINTGKNVDLSDGSYCCDALVMSTFGQALFSNGRGRIIKRSNGTLLTGTANYLSFYNIQFIGIGFSGDNVVITGNNPTFLNCSSNGAGGRALKATGSFVQIFGTNNVFQTTDTSATGYDVEIGVIGTTTGYHQIHGLYTSQATGGLLLIDTGSHVLSGGQLGKLTIKNGTSPAGVNGGMTSGCRILGDVTVELSSAIFSGNQFGAVAITFALGTSGCRLDTSNTFQAGATVVNNGNANNLIIREVSTGSVNTLKFGPDANSAEITIGSSGNVEVSGDYILKNDKALRLRKADGSQGAYFAMSTANNLTLVNDTSGKPIIHGVTGTTTDSVHLFLVDSVGKMKVTNTGVYIGGLSALVTQGTGSPEGVVTAGVGSLYQRTDGGAGTSLYVKESGTGNTGWIGK